MSAPRKTLYVVNAAEPVLVSWARDLFTFGSLIFASWFVNVMIPPSGWLNMTVAVVWFIWILGRASRHQLQVTADEARAWLDEHFPEGR